jgi:hypothetical protein
MQQAMNKNQVVKTTRVALLQFGGWTGGDVSCCVRSGMTTPDAELYSASTGPISASVFAGVP